jgi:hypothetical protein
MAEINMLSHLSTLEISNVKRAANRRTYAITKSEEAQMKIVQAVLSTPAEGETEFVATLKSAGADEKRIEAATAMYRMRKGFEDVLQPEDLGVTAKAHKEPDGDEQEEDESDEAFKSRMAKAKAKKAKKCDEPAHKSADPEVEAKLSALFKSNQMLASQLQEQVAKSEQLEYVAKAEREFSHVPGSSADLAVALKAAHDAGPSAEKVLTAALKSVNELVSKSAMLREVGTAGGTAGSAYQQIEALANGLTMKADSGKEMSKAQKVAYVTSNTAEGRALYAQYNEEQRQALKRM